MTDGQGRTVNFKNTVIVMTSNLGSQMIQQMAGQDYQVVKLAVMGEVKSNFRPEFVNRIDEIVVFHALDEANIASIARVQLKELEARRAMRWRSRAGCGGELARRIRSRLRRAAVKRGSSSRSRPALEVDMEGKSVRRTHSGGCEGGVFSCD